MTDSTIPFHEANFDDGLAKATLVNGKSCDLPGNRRVEVWHIVGKDGYCVRIFRPTADGKMSKLCFGLSEDAAIALYWCLQAKIGGSHPEQIEAA